MVWLLRAVHASLVPSTYYFTLPGIYTVGRKDCSITILSDKSISRVHAHLIIEAASTPNRDVEEIAQIPRMPLRVKDLSKFGTYVNKETVSTPGSEAILKEGDLVTFGNNKTTFRVEFVPLYLCIPSPANQSKRDEAFKAVAAIGAYAVEKWKEDCTHVLVEEGFAVNEVVTAAVTSRKPVVQLDWLQAIVAQSSPSNDLPSLSSFLPTLMFQGRESAFTLKLAVPQARKILLQGYTFFIGPLQLYEHGANLVLLIEAGGGCVELISSKSNSPHAGSGQQLVVKPRDGWSAEGMRAVGHLPRTTEEKVVVAVLTGHLDVVALQLPASPVASASTDETMDEEDAEDLHDTAAMDPPKMVDAAELHIEPAQQAAALTPAPLQQQASWHSVTGHLSSPGSLEGSQMSGRNTAIGAAVRKAKQEQSREGLMRSQDLRPFAGREGRFLTVSTPQAGIKQEASNLAEDVGETVKADIVYSSVLIAVKDGTASSPQIDGLGPNFKRFKKGLGASGNSFTSLVPFAKEPYREADFEKEAEEFMREERKRKAADNLADDLFNAERLKRQKAAVPQPRGPAKSSARG